MGLEEYRQLFYLMNCPGTRKKSDERIANYLCFQTLYITIHQHIYMNGWPIVSLLEVEKDIALGALIEWTTFHEEQNHLNLLHFRPQLFFGTIWMRI